MARFIMEMLSRCSSCQAAGMKAFSANLIFRDAICASTLVNMDQMLQKNKNKIK